MTLLLLGLLKKIIKVLVSNAGPQQIAAGICMGMLIGFIPFNVLLYLLFLLFICILKINIAAISLGIVVFTPLTFVINPFVDSLGYYLLVDAKALQNMWTYLYNLPLIPWFKFNHTLQLGYMIIALLLLYPLFKLSEFGITYSQNHLATRIAKLPFIKALSASPIIKWFFAIKKWIS